MTSFLSSQQSSTPAAQTGVETSGPGLIPGTGRVDVYNLVSTLGQDATTPVYFDTGYLPAQRQVQSYDAKSDKASLRSQTTLVQQRIDKTPLQMMDDLASWGGDNPQALLSLREVLWKRGLYGTSYKPEDLDPLRTSINENDFTALAKAIKSYYAYASANAEAGSNGMKSFKDWLDPVDANGNSLLVGPAQSGSGAGPAPAPQYQLSTAQNIGDQNAQNLLGHSLTSGQAGDLQGALNANSQSEYGQRQNDDPQAFARSWLVSNNMDEYKQHQAAGYMSAFLNLLAPGVVQQTKTGDVAVG